MSGKKILCFAGDYVEDYEIMVPYQCLLALGHQVHVVSPGKKKDDKIITAVHDFNDGEQTYTELRGHRFVLNYDFDAVKVEDYDALLIPGGRAPEHLRMNEKIIQWTQYFASAKKPIAAICHGPQILSAANVIKGQKIAAYPACKPEIVAAGAVFADTCAIDGAVVSDDGVVITGCAWPGHPAWLKEFIKALGTKITL
eukprot:TRINITY_DN3274_c0_g1_i1.p1 TRINITY_DN3274_c0_g1~~TRINITY_DN3274_c0_g1_i1.p1  ORF type:complete len:198 (-),score=51.62 TRINITY_DN3274_c0_g1_i1:75-668(-)